MKNYETEAAWRYHNGTKHPNGFLLDAMHRYHPASRPNPYKQYIGAVKKSLAPDKSSGNVPTLDAISCTVGVTGEQIPDISFLSTLLYFSGGITRTIRFPPPLGSVEFRAASCTGALYHIEMYLVCSSLPGLGAGVYHYSPKDDLLSTIRTGDYRKVLVEAAACEPYLSGCPAAIIFTDIFSKNAVKYQAREYRHAFWDAGTIISNSLAVACSKQIPHRVVLGFADASVNQLLGLDGKKEAAIALLALGHTSSPTPPPPPLGRTPEPEDYAMAPEAILEMHESSSLESSEVDAWRRQVPPNAGPCGAIIPLGPEANSGEALEQTILRRGSTRRFSHEPISVGQLSAILKRSSGGFPSDYMSGTANDIFIIANAVDGLANGSYCYERKTHSLESLQSGILRDISGHLGLDQSIPYDAAAVLFFMSDLQEVLKKFGNRGYRVAQLDASIAAGKMYLAAYALKIGATGLTFYDDEVTGFFGPHAQGKSPMFMMAFGKKEGKIFGPS